VVKFYSEFSEEERVKMVQDFAIRYLFKPKSIGEFRLWMMDFVLYMWNERKILPDGFDANSSIEAQAEIFVRNWTGIE